MLNASLFDNSATHWFQGLVTGVYSGSTSNFAVICSNSNVYSSVVSFNVPFTWGTSDALYIGGSYESI